MKNLIIRFRLQILALILSLAVIIIDRLSEYVVSIYLQESEGFIKVTPFLNLIWIGNSGVSFGMLQDLPHGKWLISGFALIITAFFFMWLLRTRSFWVSCALGLLIGGALGNTLERFKYGHVIDILNFHAYGYHWPAFNINDSAIFIGAILLIYYEFFKSSRLKYKGQE